MRRNAIKGLRAVGTLSAALAAAALPPAGALACTTCGVGSSALTPAGQGLPLAGRTRLSTEFRIREDVVRSAAANDLAALELRLTTGVTYAPSDRVWLAAIVPLVLRSARWQNLQQATTLGPGDIEVGVRYLLWRDRRFDPTHLVGLVAGLKLPTSIDQHDTRGRRLDNAAQTGSGTFDPAMGAYYTFLEKPWSLFAQTELRLPVFGRFEVSPGPLAVLTAAVQLQLFSQFSGRLGVEARHQWASPSSDNQSGRADFSVLTLFPSVLWSPQQGWLVVFGVGAPLFQASPVGRRESLSGVVSVVVDV